MDDALFLQAARVSGKAHKRMGDLTMTVHTADWLRLLEMAERWQAHEELCRAAADVLDPPPSAPSDALS